MMGTSFVEAADVVAFHPRTASLFAATKDAIRGARTPPFIPQPRLSCDGALVPLKNSPQISLTRSCALVPVEYDMESRACLSRMAFPREQATEASYPLPCP